MEKLPGSRNPVKSTAKPADLIPGRALK